MSAVPMQFVPRGIHDREIACRVDAAVKALSRAKALLESIQPGSAACTVGAKTLIAADRIDEAERDLAVVQALVRREVQ